MSRTITSIAEYIQTYQLLEYTVLKYVYLLDFLFSQIVHIKQF